MEGILGDLLDEKQEILASFDVNPIAEAVGCGFARDCSETYLKIPLSTHDPLPLLADRLNLVVTPTARYSAYVQIQVVYDVI